MPDKRLIAASLVSEEGEFCTLGVLGKARGIDMENINPDDWDEVAQTFNMAPAMVREIVYENDECLHTYEWVEHEICGPVRQHWPEYGSRIREVQVKVPEDVLARKRWKHMKEWVDSAIVDKEKT